MNSELEAKLLSALKEVSQKNGLIYPEKGASSEILCKPKILPMKSLTLEKLEEMEKALTKASKENN